MDRYIVTDLPHVFSFYEYVNILAQEGLNPQGDMRGNFSYPVFELETLEILVESLQNNIGTNKMIIKVPSQIQIPGLREVSQLDSPLQFYRLHYMDKRTLDVSECEFYLSNPFLSALPFEHFDTLGN